MGQAEFTGTSLKDAFEKTKKVLGEDAYIIHSEETKDGVRIIATSSDDRSSATHEQELENLKNVYAVTKSTLRNFKKTLEENKSPIDIIKSVIDICEYQGLSSPFCDAWLNALSADFKKDHFFLDEALERILPFNENWIRELSPEKPIILVGPPGSGKTALAGKLVLILKSLKRNVQVVSLDTQKAGATTQLAQYIAPFSMNLEIGYDGYIKAKNECITKDQILIVDTPGVNILSQEGQEFFYKLSEKLRDPLTLVLPNDMKSTLMTEIAREYKNYNAKYLIGTRFDLDQLYGGFFTTVYESQLEPVLYSDAPKISEPVHMLTPQKALKLLTIQI